MLIYNSLGRRKEEFTPVRPGHARVYVCGITAYDYCHIGHARSAIVYDVLVRHLRLSGLQTLFIRNFTDIDDKIINRANKEGRDWRELGEFYIHAFNEDMAQLGVQRPDMEPRATDFIPEIIRICERLSKENLAYATEQGDVYFRVRAWPQYGKLSGRDLDEMRAGARVSPGEGKEDPLDFALWKAAKPGEPSWPSPWGQGRPGWHIECSAMNQPFLPLDIHGGGQDLLFPHHENEIAQSEAMCKCELAKYWMHNGFVQINSEKMSKSLGNFQTIRQILQNWLPETLRFFLLQKHYRSPIDFTPDGMEDTEKAQKRVYGALAESSDILAHANWRDGDLPAEMAAEWQELEPAFRRALDDDLNTAQALGHVFSAVRLVNRLLENKKLRLLRQSGAIYEEFLERSRYWQAVLGLFGENPHDFLNRLKERQTARMRIDMARVETLLQKRIEARAEKNYALSDSLRDELAALGIAVKDGPNGQSWDLA